MKHYEKHSKKERRTELERATGSFRFCLSPVKTSFETLTQVLLGGDLYRGVYVCVSICDILQNRHGRMGFETRVFWGFNTARSGENWFINFMIR